MEWMGLNELRESFLAFFESKGHTRLPSAPLVPQGDSSLLLINSGMAPLKKYFLGLETPPNKRVTTCQKCIRTPDIERVGKTSRHGTYFEMLGNFSFGDYFKEEATTWAWEFITKELKIPTDRLWVSIYENDDDAFEIWTKRRGVSPDRIVRLGKEDNFWEIGSGPCGPCSEIYFDRGEASGCGSPDCAVGCDCDRYVEFWNLVFTQFNSDGEGNYTPLEHPNIDTGMGLERLACIMQGVDNLFEVDTVQNIMKHIARIAGVTYKQNERTDVSLRVVTDHIRSTVFMVGDGVTPSNEGRGYVLRRLLRRAARHGRLLGITRPFLFEVCDTVIEENRTAYPALTENAGYIKEVIRLEEERFSKTIAQGMELLGQLIDRVELSGLGKKIIDGLAAFNLYDTFGFPLDLTKEIAADHGIEIDEDGFLAQMEQQRRRAREAREKNGGVGWEEDVLAQLDIEDSFTYGSMKVDSKILEIVAEGQRVQEIVQGQEGVLLLQETPFYAESGGQIGDTGTIALGDSVFAVENCKKSPTGHILHIGRVVSGSFKAGEKAVAAVDENRRRAIMRNHTSAHLLQAALRQVLGEHVHQAGQMVDNKACRFDFTHFSAVTSEQLKEIEALVNGMILDSIDVSTTEMPIEQAKELGAMALFGDKYSDVVRVCNVGGRSIELCGGTHVANTAQIGLFRILHETSVAAGVRRIEAVTGSNVLAMLDEKDAILQSTCEALKVGGAAELPARAAALTQELKDSQREIQRLSSMMAAAQSQSALSDMTDIGPVAFVSVSFNNAGVEALRSAADKIKSQHSNAVGLLVSREEAKATLFVFAGPEALEAGIHCGNLVKAVAGVAGGSGGGRPDGAMGGIADLSQVDKAIAAAPGLVEEVLAKK
ncbi:alanine--tRNA ligase [Oscillospiraceae bacterium MB08-C2-2]|nr:alanine--tRNA ligase [Oscillospiraceae bacterium MB08-C2-2]